MELYPNYEKMMQSMYESTDDLVEGTMTDDKFVEKLKKSQYVKEVDYSFIVNSASKYKNDMSEMLKSQGRDPMTLMSDNLEGETIKYRIPTFNIKSFESLEKEDNFDKQTQEVIEVIRKKELMSKN